MAKLSSALVLNKYILSLFGVKDLAALSENLKDSALEGYDENNVSHFHHALIARMYSSPYLSRELLYQYDQNIYGHTRAISDKRDKPIKWKYFQYLCLLFTEIYLDKYFSNKEQLLYELNEFLITSFVEDANSYKDLTPFVCNAEQNDLNKLAYWNATGSGKTLLMHVNILQYQAYLKKHNEIKGLNRIIVLTPNEGLSKQHLKEFSESGLDAELFDKTGGTLFRGNKIELIEISRLKDRSGPDTVALESFETNNLLLVDEGHKGLKETNSSLPWKKIRDSLAEEGFTFEYSATFGQAVSAAGPKQEKEIINEYGKATLFDYSYHYFHGDGYGKDFQILNLKEDWDQDYVDLYLTACLLSFYEQLVLFSDHKQEAQTYNIEKPLAIFVGSKVTAVRTDKKQQVSDVVQVLKFIEGFVKKPEIAIRNVERLLSGNDGLNDSLGRPIFKNAFKYLNDGNASAAAVYNQLLNGVFHSEISGAFLHLDNLKGQDGEIGLKIGTGDYFGVINVGDDAKLLKLCSDEGIATGERDFSDSLFQGINEKDSKVNILIGSKKFSEGWSSWRVSIMGLMNIGRGEGSEVIQLFGRGVRLKGYRDSLKRSSALDLSMKPGRTPGWLPTLETLNIFGVRANYMEEFKDVLEEEGMPVEPEYEEVSIKIVPTISDLLERKLKYLRTKDGANFKRDKIVERLLGKGKPAITLNWYPKVQMLKSASSSNVSQMIIIEEGKLQEHHLAFLDWDEIYFEIEKFKNERSWHNLNISKNELRTILYDSSWYTLQIPHSRLEFSDYERNISDWREIGQSLLKMFCERAYNFEKNKYYSDKMEVATLDYTHPNFDIEYKLQVKKSETTLIAKIKSLKQLVQDNSFRDSFKIETNFDALYNPLHLYAPLFYIEKGNFKEVIKIQPVPLNEGENDFVNDLKKYYAENKEQFANQNMYLLRNLSRKGIGFFEANNFYPDFILWLTQGSKQKVAFVDPKGLRQIQGFADSKIQLHKRIREETQPQLADPDIELYSFIISNTPYKELEHWKGQNGISDFNKMNVLFQKDQRENYISVLLSRIGV